MKQLLLILVPAILFSAPVAAGEDGIVVRTGPVYEKATYRSKRIGQVRAGTAVSIEIRRGGWKNVVSEKDGIDGWIRSYQVRAAATTPTVKVNDSDSRGFLAGLASFSRKASSFFKSDSEVESSGTATIGVRGLSEEEIKGAEADFAEFDKLLDFGSSKKRSANFARKGDLKAVEVPHIGGKEK